LINPGRVYNITSHANVLSANTTSFADKTKLHVSANDGIHRQADHKNINGNVYSRIGR